MACCPTLTAEDKLEPYQLRALYIRQISKFAQTGIFGQALNVFKEVSLCLIVIKSSLVRGELTQERKLPYFHEVIKRLLLVAMQYAISESFKIQMEFSACFIIYTATCFRKIYMNISDSVSNELQKKSITEFDPDVVNTFCPTLCSALLCSALLCFAHRNWFPCCLVAKCGFMDKQLV